LHFFIIIHNNGLTKAAPRCAATDEVTAW